MRELGQCWTNDQYTRRECLEITGLPELNENRKLEELTLKVLKEIVLNIDSGKVEDCHWIKAQVPKKFINISQSAKTPINFESRRKS